MRVEVVTDNAWEKLKFYAAGASCIRAVMAYWTIPAADLPNQMIAGLCRQGGFVCVDINQPTSISALNSLHQVGVHTRLHLMTTTGRSEISDSVGMPNHLMHSKAIIFDYDGRDSMVWVGSHNGTFRALDGINFECALAVAAGRESMLYQEVESHVNRIHAACQPFRPDLMEHYRYLQGAKLDNAVSVIDFENGNDQPLQLSDEIAIFNMGRDDARVFKTLDTDVIVSLHGSREILYAAKVVQTGETPTSQSQKFSDRRYADRQSLQLPVLLGQTPVTSAMHKRGTYFASVKIVSELDSSFHLLEIPTQNAWVDLPAVELSQCAQVDSETRPKRVTRSVKPKGLSFKVPAFEEMASEQLAVSAEVRELRTIAFKEMRLEEKRAAKRSALIKKKLLVRR